MSAALIAALFFTVILLVITAYFLMGSVPLLILKHDTPMDGNFVRGFFDIYYRVAMVSAGATALSYALAGRFVFAAGAGGLMLLAVLLRRQVIPRMDAMRTQMQVRGTDAIPGFRRIHITAILVTVAQLVLIVWGLITLSMQWSTT